MFINWLNKVINKKNKTIGAISPEPIRSNTIDARGMNFTIYKANGGFVLEHRQYDSKTDRSNNYLHIITEEMELCEEIAKIITYTTLRS